MLLADCNSCFGLCCVALPYAKSADFAKNKDGGKPCQNLDDSYRCTIHSTLREQGFKGCTVYECYGAGQKVSQHTFNGSWRDFPDASNEMFDVFPIMQQLHEMLYYLHESLQLEEALPLHHALSDAIISTEELTKQTSKKILQIDVQSHRIIVNELLLETSKLVRKNEKAERQANPRIMDLIGANLKGKVFKGSDLRGALLIATDLRNADLRKCDFIGADLRDANLCGADLRESIFLTQAQLNAANGDMNTKLPVHLKRPPHWQS
ncbi:pentapeptide repeat-containing protein [Bacillus sp. BGMRC 2118]|nr:pentapeptide repeat-containing protein [Bacillus sp. BGMRC 2118]